MTAIALALHTLGAVVWVGGMFAIYMCLRPALGTLEPPQRMRLMRITFQKFFPWVSPKRVGSPPVKPISSVDGSMSGITDNTSSTIQLSLMSLGG